MGRLNPNLLSSCSSVINVACAKGSLTCLHLSEVMSSWIVTTLGMALMGTKSTPGRQVRRRRRRSSQNTVKSKQNPPPPQVFAAQRSDSPCLPTMRLEMGMNFEATCSLWQVIENTLIYRRVYVCYDCLESVEDILILYTLYKLTSLLVPHTSPPGLWLSARTGTYG